MSVSDAVDDTSSAASQQTLLLLTPAALCYQLSCHKNPLDSATHMRHPILAMSGVFFGSSCLTFSFSPNCTSSRSHEEGGDEELYVSQEGVHRAVGAEIVNNVLNGVSASCFAYGHTGEGNGRNVARPCLTRQRRREDNE
jgi:hypothetical protein